MEIKFSNIDLFQSMFFLVGRQTYVFQSKIAQGIPKWVQNNQLSSLPSNVFFKKLFLVPEIIKKIGRFVNF